MTKFGILVMPQHPVTDSSSERFRETVQLTRLARDAGFDSISCGQHYLAPPYQNLQSIPLLARLAADSGDMSLVLGVLLLPLFSPADVAESVASLDIISGGKVILGVGLGYRDVEYEAFGVDRRDRVGRFLESLEIVKLLWAEEKVTFVGKHFRLTDATCTIRPLQNPHPPIWIAANNDDVVRRAGTMGYSWLANPHATLATLERQMLLHREGLAHRGLSDPAERPIIKELHVSKTRDAAIRVAKPYLEGKYRAYADWGQDKALPGKESFTVPFANLARDRFILGSVEEVIQQIEEHQQRLGVDHFIFRIWWPGMEARQAYRVLELVAEYILPHFKKLSD